MCFVSTGHTSAHCLRKFYTTCVFLKLNTKLLVERNSFYIHIKLYALMAILDQSSLQDDTDKKTEDNHVIH